MRTIFEAAGIALLLSFTWGCVPGGLLLTDASNMTPEQMAAYEKLGYDAIRCATISGGPPVGGVVTSVTVPKNRQALVKFVGCQVQTIDVGAAAVGAEEKLAEIKKQIEALGAVIAYLAKKEAERQAIKPGHAISIP